MTFIILQPNRIKDKYLKLYQSYCRDLSCIEQMKRYIYRYSDLASLWTEELYEIYCKEKPVNTQSLVLRTNGSTNLIPTEYPYTYNSFLLKDDIWNYMHRYYGKRERYWIDLNRLSKNDNILDIVLNEGKTFYLNCNMGISLDFNNSFWITTPFNLHYVSFYPNILEYIRLNKIVISLTEMDCSSYNFDKLSVPIVNQMRSWKEGTSFYTCPYGKFHWMENLFYCTPDKKIVDLFNFCNSWWDKENGNPDNIWLSEQEFHQCECGTWYREMNFQPHAIKFFYSKNGSPAKFPRANLDFINLFEHFQIIQNKRGDKFTIYSNDSVLVTKSIEEIRFFLERVYESKDFQIDIRHEEYKVGERNKRPLFWSEYEYISKNIVFNSV